MSDKARAEFEEWLAGKPDESFVVREIMFHGWLAAKEKYEPKISGYGCHCDLEPNQSPDGCVIDEGRIHDCVYARSLSRDGKGRDDCDYWQPIREPSTQGGGE